MTRSLCHVFPSASFVDARCVFWATFDMQHRRKPSLRPSPPFSMWSSHAYPVTAHTMTLSRCFFVARTNILLLNPKFCAFFRLGTKHLGPKPLLIIVHRLAWLGWASSITASSSSVFASATLDSEDFAGAATVTAVRRPRCGTVGATVSASARSIAGPGIFSPLVLACGCFDFALPR